MSSATLVRQGEPVPISLQLVDGATGKFPQAELYSPSGSLLSTLNLVHRAQGLYTPAAIPNMPAESFISVVFITYDDSGHTTESSTHHRVADIFLRSTYAGLADSVDGSATMQDALANANAAAANKVIRTGGNQYSYRNADGTGTLFTNVDNANERTPA